MVYRLRVTDPSLQSAGCRELVFDVPVVAEGCNMQTFVAANGDGIADLLDFGDHAGRLRLEVFDMRGRLVHRDEDYLNDWDASGLARGIYVYRVNVEGECGGMYVGRVLVVR
jgi:hypothetical protein